MSRSVRHHPFCGITTSVSEAWWKRVCNRALRAAVRCRMAGGEDADALLVPTLREVTRQWGPKDGMQRFNPTKYPELMRK